MASHQWSVHACVCVRARKCVVHCSQHFFLRSLLEISRLVSLKYTHGHTFTLACTRALKSSVAVTRVYPQSHLLFFFSALRRSWREGEATCSPSHVRQRGERRRSVETSPFSLSLPLSRIRHISLYLARRFLLFLFFALFFPDLYK